MHEAGPIRRDTLHLIENEEDCVSVIPAGAVDHTGNLLRCLQHVQIDATKMEDAGHGMDLRSSKRQTGSTTDLNCRTTKVIVPQKNRPYTLEVAPGPILSVLNAPRHSAFKRTGLLYSCQMAFAESLLSPISMRGRS
jgi:hypothetical protein